MAAPWRTWALELGNGCSTGQISSMEHQGRLPEESEDKLTMMLLIQNHAVEFGIVNGSKVAVDLKVSPLVGKEPDADGVVELKRGLQSWEVVRKNPPGMAIVATAAAPKPGSVKHIMA